MCACACEHDNKRGCVLSTDITVTIALTLSLSTLVPCGSTVSKRPFITQSVRAVSIADREDPAMPTSAPMGIFLCKTLAGYGELNHPGWEWSANLFFGTKVSSCKKEVAGDQLRPILELYFIPQGVWSHGTRCGAIAYHDVEFILA